jgi:tyrosyl-tRNA synthetase
MDFYGELEWRGLVHSASEGAREVLARDRVTGYIGFDPTASSLHVGSLLVMTALARLQRAGHTPIAVVGGGTGLIGDPKPTTERALLTIEQVEKNVAGIRPQLERVLDFDHPTNPARLINNADWLTTLGAVAFMRDVGKHFSVNAMVAKESVKKRMEGEGISYTEFSYALLQAYDYLELYRRYGCTLQMGGSDQWGNITAGMDLIRRVEGGKAYGLVMPLITTSAGTKFGKTEAGTVWLDADRTSPYEFYQFWLNADDRDAVRYLRFFTFLDEVRIREIEAASMQQPEKRHAQRELAREITRLVHGDAAVHQAETAAEALFRKDLSGISFEGLVLMAQGAPTIEVAARPEGWRIQALLTQAGLARSSSQAAQLVRGGGIYLNNEVFLDERGLITPAQAVEGKGFVLRKGKKDQVVVKIVASTGVDSGAE